MLHANKAARFLGVSVAVAAVGAFVWTSIAGAQDRPKAQPKPLPKAEVHVHPHPNAAPINKAVAVLTPTEGNETRGTVTFTRTPEGMLIEAEITGLDPNSEHGFHIHQYGDMRSGDGDAMGGHYNPTAEPHAGPDADQRHVGDFGNIETDAEGVGRYRRVDDRLTFEGPTSILGRGMIVHDGTDDLETQPTGDAGARRAQGVIGVANEQI